MFTFRQGPADDPENEYTDRNAKLLADRGATKIALIGANNQASALFIERIKQVDRADGQRPGGRLRERVGPADPRPTSPPRCRRSRAPAPTASTPAWTSSRTPRLRDALAKAGVEMKATIFPGGYDPRRARPPRHGRRVFGLEFYPLRARAAGVRGVRQVRRPRRSCGARSPSSAGCPAEMFIEGLKQAGLGCPTREAFIANLRLVDDYDGGGAFDPVDLSDGLRRGVPVRVLRRGRGRGVRAAVRRRAVLR